MKYVTVLDESQLEWKLLLKATRRMGKGLHKVFSTIIKEISQELANLGESGSEISHFIPEPRKFAEVQNCQKILENLGGKQLSMR